MSLHPNEGPTEMSHLKTAYVDVIPAWKAIPADAGAKTKVKRERAPWIRLAVSQVFGAAWVAVMVILLAINFKRWVLGASVGCGFRENCDYDPYSLDALKEAQRLDKKDHNILGALQFVAKALEVWFVALAVSLVYDLTVLLAAKSEGLPIGYLFAHAEFADLMTLFDKGFWTSAKPNGKGGWTRRSSLCLYGFVLLNASLCIAANLMGPAAAVLVIPTLTWSTVVTPGTQRFASSGASLRPMNVSIASECTQTDLDERDYSCARIYAKSLDSLTSQNVAGTYQSEIDPYVPTMIPGISQENQVSFRLNFTADRTGGLWVPSRQVLRELSNDLAPYLIAKISNAENELNQSMVNDVTEAYYNRTVGPSLWKSYRNSLSAVLHRVGPSFNLNGYCYRGNSTFLRVAENKFVRCFNGMNQGFGVSVKCIQDGSGWGGYSENSNFSIGDPTPSADGDVSVSVYSTSRAVYLGGDQIACSLPARSPSAVDCDWDEMFAEKPPSVLANRTQAQQIVEYNLPHSFAGERLPSSTVWCESIARLNFTDYTLDPSPITNSLHLVSTESTPDIAGTTPINVHPDWTLAGWSIRHNGTVDGLRSTAQNLISALRIVTNSDSPGVLADEDDASDDPEMSLLLLQHFFIEAHTLSLVSYTTQPLGDEKKKDLQHPILPANVAVRAWSYGIASRTSKVGTVVAFFGIVVVLFRGIISAFVRVKRRKTLDILATALEQDRDAVFRGLDSQRAMSKMRFRTNAKRDEDVQFITSN